MAKSIIGFHYGPGANDQKKGIGDFMRRLNERSLPFLMKGADHAGICFEGQELAKELEVANWLIYRTSTRGQDDGNDYDVPDYLKSPQQAAAEHWEMTLAKWPPELDPATVWMEPINEPRAKLTSEEDRMFEDMHPVDWLGRFMLEYAKIANNADPRFKVCGPSFNSGEPEVFDGNDYEQQGMLEYLRYCADHPDRAALSVHEYFKAEWENGLHPTLREEWGRAEAAFAAADRHNIARNFSIFVTEWGFDFNNAPRWPECEPYLSQYNAWAARWPQVKGVAAWSLQGAQFEGAAKDIHTWIEPLSDYAIASDFDSGPQPAQVDEKFGETSPTDDTGTDTGTVSDEWEPPSGQIVEGWIWEKHVERKGDLGRVQASGGLNLRADSAKASQKKGLVPFGTIVRIVGTAQGDPIVYLPVEVSEGDLRDKPIAPPAPTQVVQLQFGIHDLSGADWMKEKSLKGWALHNIALKKDATKEDFGHYEQAGIKLLIRLNYGYMPEGNIPLPDMSDYEAFIGALVRTIQDSRGVWGWIIGNETNNAQEWPGGPDEGTPITAQDYVELYNRIYSQKPSDARIGPQAIDPYHPRSGDSRVYWKQILNGIKGAEFLTVHPKTQDSNPDSVDSNLTFEHEPLVGMFQNLRSYQPLLKLVPSRFRNLPVIATEVNPQRRDDGSLGWQDERGPEWVRRAVKHFRKHNATAVLPISGVIFYRFDGDQWKLREKADILAAIDNVSQA